MLHHVSILLSSLSHHHQKIQTNGNHALAITIQILQHHLTNRKNAITAAVPSIPCLHPPFPPLLFTQPPSLLLQIPHQPRQFAHHARISTPLGLFINNQAKIEYKIRAGIQYRIVNANRKPNDAVVGSEQTQRAIAEFAAGDDVVGYAGEVEERLLGCVCEGDDAAFGHLVQDGGTCVMSLCQISGSCRWFLEFSCFDKITDVIWA